MKLNDAMNAYNSLPLLDLDYLFDATAKNSNGRQCIPNIVVVGFLKGLCDPPEVQGLLLKNKTDKFGVVSLVGAVLNYTTGDPIYYKAMGNVLTLVPIETYSKISKMQRPLIAMGQYLNKNIRNPNMLQMFKLVKYDNISYMAEVTPNFKDMGYISIPVGGKWQGSFNASIVASKVNIDLSVFKGPLCLVSKQNFADYIASDLAAPERYNERDKFLKYLKVDWFFEDTPDALQDAKKRIEREKELNTKPEVGGVPEIANYAGEPPATLGVGGADTWADRAVADSKKSVFKVTSRKELTPQSKIAEDFNSKVQEAKTNVDDILNTLDDFTGKHDLEEAIDFTAKQLKKYWSVKGKNTKKGADIFLEAVQRVDDSISAEGWDSIFGKSMTIKGAKIIDDWVNPDSLSDDKVTTLLSEKRAQIYFAIIERTLGITGLADVYESSEDFDMYSVLCENPYYLCLIDARIDIKSLDILAMLYNTDKSKPDVQKLRNVAFMHNVFMKDDSRLLNGNTLIEENLLRKKLSMSYRVNQRVITNMQEYGCVLIEGKFNDLHTFIDSDVTKEQLCYKQNELRSSNGYTYCNIASSVGVALKDFCDSGVGIKSTFDGVGYYTDYVLAKKENYVYRKVYELCKAGTSSVPPEELDTAIESFEKMKQLEGIPDFKLEPLQADAVKLLKHNVVCLTGPAGSGKTTTAEAILYAIQTLLATEDDKILFAAPTGKAANRLKEVVKKPTGTIHSKFQIAGDDLSLREANEASKSNKKDIDVLIVDESSMITLDLMYNMLRKVSTGTRIYFLGDIEQLPPIGFGKPFANFLRFLPCVKLEVSKRASEKSTINFNAKAIINNSTDDATFMPLKQGDDFKLIESDINDAALLVHKLVRWHLGLTNVTPVKESDMILDMRNLKPDDIQIITPFSSKEKATSTFNLNPLVQDSFNPKLKNQRVYRFMTDRKGETFTEFRVGDRVINTKNSTEKKGFLSTPDGLKLMHEGIMNGDTGKIVGFWYADDLKFHPDSEKLIDDFKGSDKTLFVAVQFESTTDDGESIDLVYLYRTKEESVVGNEVIINYSLDLRVLDLAYALTVHKLQGSQAKLVIFVAAEGTPTFVCRNLIYTAITRATTGCYIVGDVKGKSSLISQGRQIETANSRESVMDMF